MKCFEGKNVMLKRELRNRYSSTDKRHTHLTICTARRIVQNDNILFLNMNNNLKTNEYICVFKLLEKNEKSAGIVS